MWLLEPMSEQKPYFSPLRAGGFLKRVQEVSSVQPAPPLKEAFPPRLVLSAEITRNHYSLKDSEGDIQLRKSKQPAQQKPREIRTHQTAVGGQMERAPKLPSPDGQAAGKLSEALHKV